MRRPRTVTIRGTRYELHADGSLYWRDARGCRRREKSTRALDEVRAALERQKTEAEVRALLLKKRAEQKAARDEASGEPAEPSHPPTGAA